MEQVHGKHDVVEDEVLRALESGKNQTERTGPGPLRRIFTDPTFAVRVARHLLGMPMPLATEDRRVLEEVIFPYFQSSPEIRRVLFVGCAWYTKHYRQTFKDADYWTIDPDPTTRKFATRQHFTASLERLGDFFPEGHFDLIVCNGVYGFGLDGIEECDRAFQQCHSRLAEGGIMLLGWDDIPARTPVPLADIASLDEFERFIFPPLETWRYLTDTPYRHTYDFYQKGRKLN